MNHNCPSKESHMNHKRPSKDRYYLDIAAVVASRSTCLRRQYGAVIVKDDEIISTGYNGGIRGGVNCCEIGECQREKFVIPHGEQYEKCYAVHAEQNAIISVSRRDMIGATLYLAGFENGQRMPSSEVFPCYICQKMLWNAGIRLVVTNDRYARPEDDNDPTPANAVKRIFESEEDCV